MQTSHPQNWTSRTSRMLTTPQHLPKPPKSWALRLDVKASATSGGFLGVRVLHKIRQIIRKIYSSFARILFLQKCEFSPNPETSSFSKQQVFVCGTFMYIPYKYIYIYIYTPSRELTYPTWGKGNSSTQTCLFSRGYVSSQGIFQLHTL